MPHFILGVIVYPCWDSILIQFQIVYCYIQYKQMISTHPSTQSQMDYVCQRYHKECSTRTCADDYYCCWKSPNSNHLCDHGFMDVIKTPIARQSVNHKQSFKRFTNNRRIILKTIKTHHNQPKSPVTILNAIQHYSDDTWAPSGVKPPTTSLLFRRTSKETYKLALLALCGGNPRVTNSFPSQRSSNAENFSVL